MGYISRAERENVWASERCVGPTWDSEDGELKCRGTVKQVTNTVITESCTMGQKRQSGSAGHGKH